MTAAAIILHQIRFQASVYLQALLQPKLCGGLDEVHFDAADATEGRFSA